MKIETNSLIWVKARIGDLTADVKYMFSGVNFLVLI